MASDIILPYTGSWYDGVRPRAWEMPGFLKLAGTGWRTPQRKWEQLWLERRGEFNRQLGHRKMRKYQRGVLHPVGFWVAPSDLAVDLKGITHSQSAVAPVNARIHVAYNTNGQIWWDSLAGPIGSMVYAQLTTDSDDANDHTATWFKANPSTSEGANWDFKYNNTATTGVGSIFYFRTTGGVDRTVDTWYNIDTVWADVADGTNPGGLACIRINGTAKSPSTGTFNATQDIHISAAGVGTILVSHAVDLTVIGT